MAEFEDGTTEVGDFLVGADGISSRVRASILPEQAEARYTGMVAVGGFCGADFAPPPALVSDSELTFMMGPKHQIGYARFGASLWAWWWFRARFDAARGWADHLRRVFALRRSSLRRQAGSLGCHPFATSGP